MLDPNWRPPGTYDITGWGAQGGIGQNGSLGGLGAEMEGQFTFSIPTTLTLLVGGAGGAAPPNGAASATSGGGGGGSYIDSSAIADLVEVSGVTSLDDSPNGEIIITAVPEPTTLALTGLALPLLLLFWLARKFLRSDV
ncbi:MAG TPA: glycine-rich protein [Bryobacteraceae bacterium]